MLLHLIPKDLPKQITENCYQLLKDAMFYVHRAHAIPTKNTPEQTVICILLKLISQRNMISKTVIPSKMNTSACKDQSMHLRVIKIIDVTPA